MRVQGLGHPTSKHEAPKAPPHKCLRKYLSMRLKWSFLAQDSDPQRTWNRQARKDQGIRLRDSACRLTALSKILIRSRSASLQGLVEGGNGGGCGDSNCNMSNCTNTTSTVASNSKYLDDQEHVLEGEMRLRRLVQVGTAVICEMNLTGFGFSFDSQYIGVCCSVDAKSA